MKTCLKPYLENEQSGCATAEPIQPGRVASGRDVPAAGFPPATTIPAESRPPRALGPLQLPGGGAVELYEDALTESTFSVRAGETVEAAQARHRREWKAREEVFDGPSCQ
ncbi:hypothetical protein LLG95_17175 [bacterium]|nr:hypothetical protein [bacterium]